MTLSHALFPTRSVFGNVLMVLAGTAFIAIAAQISIPMFPVPMTLQTLAILMVGMTYGARLGAVTLLVYLAEGAMGLPVFAGGAAGLPYMMGPTGGFLLGFVMMAWLAGAATEAGIADTFAPSALVMMTISALLYIPGIAWPMAVASAFGVEAGWIGQAFGDYYWPYFIKNFLIGDAVKAILAAMIITGGWAVLKSRKD